MRQKVVVQDSMQDHYVYYRTEPVGQNFDEQFQPELSPAEMLALGVFGGRYLRDCVDEFPDSWFINARLAPGSADPKLNYFGVHASQPLAEWRRKGWIGEEDPRGWFQWYCRYFMGRRIPAEDRRHRVCHSSTFIVP